MRSRVIFVLDCKKIKADVIAALVLKLFQDTLKPEDKHHRNVSLGSLAKISPFSLMSWAAEK